MLDSRRLDHLTLLSLSAKGESIQALAPSARGYVQVLIALIHMTKSLVRGLEGNFRKT